MPVCLGSTIENSSEQVYATEEKTSTQTQQDKYTEQYNKKSVQ